MKPTKFTYRLNPDKLQTLMHSRGVSRNGLIIEADLNIPTFLNIIKKPDFFIPWNYVQKIAKALNCSPYSIIADKKSF